MFPQPVTLPLLPNHILEIVEQSRRQNHVLQLEAWLAKLEKSFKVASRSSERNGNTCSAGFTGPGLVNLGSHFISCSPVSLTGFGCGNLESNREKQVVVALSATSQHGKDLLGVRHGHSLFVEPS